MTYPLFVYALLKFKASLWQAWRCRDVSAGVADQGPRGETGEACSVHLAREAARQGSKDAVMDLVAMSAKEEAV